MGHLYHGYVSHNQRVPNDWVSLKLEPRLVWTHDGSKMLSHRAVDGLFELRPQLNWAGKPQGCSCIVLFRAHDGSMVLVYMLT